MMKKYLLTSIALLSVFGLFAQNHEGHEKCGANIELERQLLDPENRASYDAFQEAVQRYTSNPNVAVTRAENGKRIIPVVFHILHEGGNENIGLNKVQQQMDVLNEDYNRLNPDTVNTPERFYGDTEYTHFVFNSDSIATYVDTSSYVSLGNSYGESFAFHFNNGAPNLDSATAALFDLSDSLKLLFDNVVEVSVFGSNDTSDIASAFASAVNSQNGLEAVYYQDSTFQDAPNFTVDGQEISALSYTSERTFTTSFVSSDPSFTVDGLVVDTLYYTTEHTYTTSWGGTETDTIYSDTLMVELFEDAINPSVATDTLNVFPADITYEVFDGSGTVTDTLGFLTQDTLVVSFLNLMVDTIYSDTLMVVLFENAADPLLPTDTLYVFPADIIYNIYDGFGEVVSTEVFAEEGDLALSYITVLVGLEKHRVYVSTDGLGYADDVLLAGVWNITANITQQGTYLPANSNVEFRLATKDPMGNCTDGVVRVFTSKTYGANDGTGFKGESYWNAYSYLNIWTVANIGLESNVGGTILGYAQFPATGPLSTDGITVLASNINTRANGGRTATHEVGHWLSLIHIWGDADCGSDNVLDTSPAQAPNFGICGNVGSPLHTQPYNAGSTCGTPDGEMFNNYMDYSTDFCMNMFTLGQKARMDYTFYGDETDPGYRGYMISQENLELTGTADPYTTSECAPITGFHFDQGSDFATQKMICVGENVDFEEDSYNGDVDSYAWTFEGGDPATDDSANPNNIEYNTPGTYDVTLQVSSSVGSDVETATDMIIVSSAAAQFQSSWGYVDAFWSEQEFLDNYVVFNQDNTEHRWEWFQKTSGVPSVRMFNYYNDPSEIDELVSPSYDLSGLDSPTLKFRYSGASVNNEPDDELRIMLSDDCGESWQTRETFSGFELTNSGLVTGSYTPNANSTWTDVSVGLGSFDDEPNVRVKFRWISAGRSNNFYIDDVTLAASPLGMEDLERQLDLSIAPNPTSDMTTLTMNLQDAANVQMEVVDVLGRDARMILSKEMSNGTHKFDIDMSSYADGVYYLRILVDSDMVVKKIVKN
jgi:PKD repeat protein